MISLISDALFNLFGSGDACYRCGRRLRQNTIDLIEEWIPWQFPLTHRGKTFSCPKEHVSYTYSIKTGKLISAEYIIGKFTIEQNYYNARGVMLPLTGSKVIWEKDNEGVKELIIPYLNVEKYTPEQVKNKIKLHLVFG